MSVTTSDIQHGIDGVEPNPRAHRILGAVPLPLRRPNRPIIFPNSSLHPLVIFQPPNVGLILTYKAQIQTARERVLRNEAGI